MRTTVGDLPLGSIPRQRRGILKRERLFEEAMRQFEVNGIDGTKVEEVVAAAGVSWGTFFRYFPRKEDVLLEAAVAHHREITTPIVEKGLEAGDPARDVVLALFMSMLVPSRYPPALHGAMLHEVTKNPARFSTMLGDLDAPVTLIRRILLVGRERGEVRDDGPALMPAAVLIAGVMFPVVQGTWGKDIAPLRALDAGVGPEPLTRAAFAIAWRAVEA
jgi:AcrR family transcriptional regulator